MTSPVNHLGKLRGYFNVMDALRSFNDEHLLEQSAWQQRERERNLAEPPDGKRYGNRFAAWRVTVTDSSVWHEIRRRREERD